MAAPSIPLSLVELSQVPVVRFGSEAHAALRDPLLGRFERDCWYVVHHGHFLTLNHGQRGDQCARQWDL